MVPTFNQLRVLLLQVRREEDVIVEERNSFLQRTRLEAKQLHTVNVFEDAISPSLIDGFDAVMLGGSGACSVTQNYPWTHSLTDLCLECAERETPLFGSCWGHQFVVWVFGGMVTADRKRVEMGTYPVTLTEEGTRDALFSTLPGRFETQMGHQDRVVALPPKARELAVSNVNPIQAFRLGDLPIYGTQFHSELDETTERQRLLAYRRHYPELDNDNAFQAILDSVKPSPQADNLLYHFLLLYALENGADRLAEANS